MKVALILNDDFSMWHFRKDLLSALIKKGLRPYVITPDGPYVSKITSLGICHIAVPMKRFISPFSDMLLMLRLYMIFRQEKFGIIHTMTIKPNIYGSIAGWLAGNRTIVGLVSGLGYMFSDEFGSKIKMLRPLAHMFYRLGFRFTSRVWFQNKEDMAYFIERKILPENKAVLIKSGGINPEEYSENSINCEHLNSLRAEFHLHRLSIVITMISARMVWSKGVREFIEASEMLQDNYPDAKFILVGPLDKDSPDAVPEEYLQKRGSSNLTIKASFRTDVKELIALSDVIVLPSYYREGVPRVLLEALSMSKPIITTDNVGCREIVENGRNGYLIPIKNSRALANAIVNLLERRNVWEAFGQYSRLKAENEFSNKLVVQKIFRELYQLQ